MRAQVGRESPAELKAAKLARGHARGLEDRGAKPNTAERAAIAAIIKAPPNRCVRRRRGGGGIGRPAEGRRCAAGPPRPIHGAAPRRTSACVHVAACRAARGGCHLAYECNVLFSGSLAYGCVPFVEPERETWVDGRRQAGPVWDNESPTWAALCAQCAERGGAGVDLALPQQPHRGPPRADQGALPIQSACPGGAALASAPASSPRGVARRWT